MRIIRTSCIAIALANILLADAAHACEVRIAYPVQELVRRASVVAEGVATGRQFEIKVTRFWKGTAARTVRLTGVDSFPGSCTFFPPSVEGKRYLFFIESRTAAREDGVDVFPGDAEVWDVTQFPERLRYFESPRRVTTRDLLRMLRGWQSGAVTDDAMRRWVVESAPVADSDELTPVVAALLELERRLKDADACRLRVIRERVVPFYIRVLADPRKALENAEQVDAEDAELLDIENELCP